jgi:1-deoxy-D-xylulose-5-phosphate synthase
MLTVKGKGYAPAETAPTSYHGVAKFDVRHRRAGKSKPECTQLYDRLRRDPDPRRRAIRIVGVTAAMPSARA